MKNLHEEALTDVERIRRLFDEIENIWSSHGPIEQYPESLLKARLDTLAAVMWSEEQKFYVDMNRDKIPLILADARH